MSAQNNSTIDSLKNVISISGNDTSKVNTLIKLSQKYYAANQYQYSKEAGENALKLANTLYFHKGSAFAYDRIAQAEEKLGNYKHSEECYLKSIELRKQINDKTLLASPYNNLGNLYNLQGNFTQALKYQYEALSIRLELKDSSTLPSSYNNIGLINFDLGFYSEAISNYEKSIAICEKKNNKKSLAIAWNNLGMVYNLQKKYNEGIVVFNRAAAINKEIGNNDFLSRNYDNISTSYRDLGLAMLAENRPDEAHIHFDEAKKIILLAIALQEKSGSKSNLGKAYCSMGKICTLTKDFNEAENYLNKSVTILAGMGVPKYLSDVYLFLSELYKEKAKEYKLPDSLKNNYLELAIINFELHHSLDDSIKGQAQTTQILNLKTKYETEKKDNEIALLNKEKDLQQLSLKQQQAALLISNLNSEKTKTEIEFLNKTKDFQELKLSKTQQELVAQMLEAKAQKANLELEKKDKALKEEQLGKEKLYKNIIFGGSLALVFISLLLFNRYRLRKKLEQQQVLINHRKQISADLHDDIGSTLSSISIYSEAMKNKYKAGDYDKAMQLAEEIGNNSREMMENMSDIVWSINPGKDDLQQISNRMQAVATNLFAQKDIATEFLMEDKLGTVLIPMQARKNIYLIFKEAINNLAKYAECKNVTVQFLNQNNNLILKISDNGKGFDTTAQKNAARNNLGGNGLPNMLLRANEINSELKIHSVLNKGTEIILKYPLVRG
ncbi:MAG: tetratricopeptide repeat protein [Bacteroidia bacterium]